MSTTVERDEKDIFYDMNPFIAIYSCNCGKIKGMIHKDEYCDFCGTQCEYIGDINARYKGIIVSQSREHPFSVNQKEYYDILWDGINNDSICLKYLDESRFIKAHLKEITNRICTECKYVKNIELQPNKYKDTINLDECISNIFKYLDTLINDTRFGTGERMIDTVDKTNIDIFISNLVLIAANRLVYWVKQK